MIVEASPLSQIDADPKPEARIKILHLVNGEHFSGAERVQDLLAMALPQFGYEVGFACLKSGKFPAVRKSVNSPCFETPMRFKFDFRCVRKIVRRFRQEQFSAIHAHTPRTLLVGSWAARILNCPLIYHVHSPVGRDSERGWTNRLNTWMETWCLRRVDRMVCVSNSLAGYMQELGHPAEKIAVVPNGVAVIEDLPEREPPTEPWTIGTMALFRPRKGTEVLLDAIARLKERGVPVRLRAVGPFETPEYKKEVMDRVETLGLESQIDWVGFQQDVNHQLQQMDLFVLPSLYGEGLPMVVLEAMATGVPVVASRVEGIPEAVRDGVDGLIFEPGNANDLAEKLESFIGDQTRWRSMSENAYDRQRTKLSDTSMAQGLAAVYDQALN